MIGKIYEISNEIQFYHQVALIHFPLDITQEDVNINKCINLNNLKPLYCDIPTTTFLLVDKVSKKENQDVVAEEALAIDVIFLFVVSRLKDSTLKIDNNNN